MSDAAGARTALVTGGRRGIGAAVAEELAASGLRVVICGRDEKQVHRAVARFAERGVRVEGVPAELATDTGRRELLRHCGAVDVLVNNAGGFVRAGTASDTDESEWHEQLLVNLTLPFLLTQVVLPGMVRRGWGRIVNIGSVVATAPQLGNAIGYVAAKAGMVGWTRQLALEVAGTGVTANVINPGTVATEHLGDYLADPSAPDEAELAARIPLGRLARPDEIAALVPYLVSDAGAFLTGAVIDVNGAAVSA